MDLTRIYPRSPKDKMLGLVSLKRTIDKAKAYNEGTLGEYHYDCPHDRPLFEFLGTNAEEFARKVAELRTDERIAAWVFGLLKNKSSEDIEQFNASRYRWHPEPGEKSYTLFMDMRDKIAPGRDDVVTWFDLLDLDEKRPVPKPTAVAR